MNAGVHRGMYAAPAGGVRSGLSGRSGYRAFMLQESDVVAYWPCYEEPGSTSHADEKGGSALSYPGTVGLPGTPVRLTGDPSGRCVGLPTAAAYRLSRGAAFTWGSAWSYEGWFWINRIVNPGALLSQWNGNGSMAHYTGGNLTTYINGNTIAWSSPPSSSILGGPHHLVVTHNGTTTRLYWDGVERASGNIGSPASNNGLHFMVGSYNSGSPNVGQDMLVSDVAFYSAALSADRVADHYGRGTAS